VQPLSRIITVATTEERDPSAMNYRSAIGGERFRASIEGKNRTVGESDQSSSLVRPARRDEVAALTRRRTAQPRRRVAFCAVDANRSSVIG
jgi:hypothetical protein